MTTMMGVPPIYLFLAQHPAFADTDLSSLERAVVGGAPMPEALLETWAARGDGVVQGYGLTEAAPNVLCLPPEDAVRRLGYAGQAVPVRRRAAFGRGRAAGARAERLRRLLAQPEATAEAFPATAGCAPATSPSATTEGFYRIKGRLKDMYISGGENVYPAEVESRAPRAPGSRRRRRRRRCRTSGGARSASRSSSPTAYGEELIEWCRARLARFKVPRAVRFVG